MRRRRTAASEPEATEPDADRPAAADTAPDATPAAPDTAPPAVADPAAPAAAEVSPAAGEPAEATAAPKRRRAAAPRRKASTPAAPAPTPEEPTAPQAAPEETPTAAATATTPVPDPEPAAEQPAAAAPEKPKRSRRRPAKAAAEPAPEADDEAAPAVPAAEVPAVAEPEAAPAEPAAAKPRRTRGVRKPKAATETAASAAEPPTPAYRPLPDQTLARLAETRVVVRKGVPELVVNGEPRLPLWFFVNTEEDPDAREVAVREIRQAYAAGIRFFTVLAHLPWRARSGERRFGPLDDVLQFVADHAPEAFVLPRLIFSPPASWERAHPGEMTRYGDGGETGDVSLGSRSFWEVEAEDAARAAVEHVAEGPHAGRVFGFYLEHGEWFHDTRGGFDLSEPNVLAFRVWLRNRYRNDLVALRAAWHDGNVTFENAAIPDPGAPAAGSGASARETLLWGERERRIVDFHEFSSDIVAQVITRLGRAIKEASGNRSAVAVSYGYTLELPRAGSGHLSLATVLASPFIDILTGPVSYSARTPGGSAPLPAPVDSVALAGKLWVSEDDTKTFLAARETPDTYNPKVTSAQDTLSVHARNFGAALAHGAGVSWMDLWGEGWLDDPQTWEQIARLRALSDRLATRRRNPRTKVAAEPDVAVIVDEHSFFGVRSDESLLGALVTQQRDALLRSGARIGFYLLSDLANRNFPTAPRLLLFLNAFRLPPEVRSAIKERFQREGRTLAWLYGPGCLETTDGDGGAAAAAGEMSDVIGMHLRLQPWGSKTGTVITDGRSPLTDGQRGQRIGDPEERRVNPSFTVADARAQVLGEYVHSGNPSLAVRKHAEWQSVFLGETRLTPFLLRGLYRLAGVPTYTIEDDVAWVGDSLICVHSAPGGAVTVALPAEAHLYDLLRGETLAAGGHGAHLRMAPRETRLLFFGTASEVARLGGDPKAGPPGLTEAELPPPPLPFSFERAPGGSERGGGADREDDVSDEDAALMEAALAGDLPLIDKDRDTAPEDADDEAAAAPDAAGAPVPQAAGEAPGGKKKRRRRRGRRGRGPEGEGTGEGAPDAGDPNPLLGGAAAEDEDDDEGDEAGADDLPARDRAAASPAAPRAMPPLSELLPDSEVPADGDLPPIPEELLPLEADAAAHESDAEGDDEPDAAAASEATSGNGRPVRRRGSRSRRGGAGRRLTSSGSVTGAGEAPAPSEGNEEAGTIER